MIEREVKILEIDKKKIEEKLLSMDAKKVFDGKLYAVFYDTETMDLNKAGRSLRLRKSPEKNTLTFKEMKSKEGVKAAEELELEVSDFNEMRSILTKLGYSERKTLTKHRTSWRFEDGTTVDIDKYWDEFDFVPEFLEVEGKDEATVFRYAEELGFNKEQCKPWSTGDLIRHYRNQN